MRRDDAYRGNKAFQRPSRNAAFERRLVVSSALLISVNFVGIPQTPAPFYTDFVPAASAIRGIASFNQWAGIPESRHLLARSNPFGNYAIDAQ